jgi:hypothetical protein
MTTNDPFKNTLEALVKLPVDELKENIASEHWPPGSMPYRAAMHILNEEERKQQNKKIEGDFELTKQNVLATNVMSKHTRSLAWATWLLAFLTFCLLLVTVFKKD